MSGFERLPEGESDYRAAAPWPDRDERAEIARFGVFEHEVRLRFPRVRRTRSDLVGMLRGVIVVGVSWIAALWILFALGALVWQAVNGK